MNENPGEDKPHREVRPGGIRNRLRKALYGNWILAGILSLVWLMLRTGRKPSRMNYPCQKAALANVTVLLGGIAAPVAARLPRLLCSRSERTWVKKSVRLAEAAVLMTLVALVAVSLVGGGGRSMAEMKAAAAGLMVPELRSDAAGASSIFVAQGIPPQSERGVDALINVMAGNGLDFFRSDRAGSAAGPDGIVGKDDMVLIKVNGEWQYRGGTNTDVVKGLVNAVVHHPDGFTGEVVIVENGQWDSYMDNRPDNRNPSNCNAEDRTQSFNDVALSFAEKNRVSVYDWTAVQTLSVGEFSGGDMRDGYVYVPEIEEGYPKFTTVYGTRISLRYGLWNGSSYNNKKVKFINVPVLKDHGYAGVTCSVKHFMGVQDLWKGTQDPPHDPMVTEGILGKLMLVARYPDLNIADAIWVTPAGGPNGPYDRAVRVDKLLASKDPVALDSYAAKHILMPISGDARHDPYGSGRFHRMLSSTRDVLLAGGKQVTMDEALMNVYTGWNPDTPPATPYDYYLAEGCTGYGFETWVLIANPNSRPAKAYVSYYTDAGCLNRDPVVVPPRSRLTLNAGADVWVANTGIRVGSDRPVYAERAMYWNDRVEGHDAVAADEGATEWHLADGHTADGFETWVEILNPGGKDAGTVLTYLTPAGRVQGPTVVVPAYSRRTVRVNDTVPSSEVSAQVRSDRPVVVEQSLYWQNRRGGSASHGATEPSEEWYFAEGSTAHGFETYLLLLNPGDGDANVELGFMTGSGEPAKSTVTVPAGTRKTVKLNDLVPDRDVSTTVKSDRPIVAERSVLWPAEGGRAGHASLGTNAPARETFLPEGCTTHGFDTWLLVQNPGGEKAVVEVYAMTDGGEKPIRRFGLAGGRRETVHLNDFYQGDLSIRVTSDRPVNCERAVYWNGRGGGTGSIGYTD